MSKLLFSQTRFLKQFVSDGDIPGIFIVHGDSLKKYEKHTYIDRPLGGQRIVNPQPEYIILMAHFTLDIAVDEIYPSLIGKSYDNKYRSLIKFGAPHVLAEIYRILTALRNCVMHDASSVNCTNDYFISVSRVDNRNNNISVNINNRFVFGLLLYITYRISLVVAKYNHEAFSDEYHNLIVNSMYNYVLRHIYIHDQHGKGAVVNIPVNIAWQKRLLVAVNEDDIVGPDRNISGKAKSLKSPRNYLSEQYDFAFESGGELYVVPNEFLLAKHCDGVPIKVTKLILETYEISDRLKMGKIEYEHD